MEDTFKDLGFEEENAIPALPEAPILPSLGKGLQSGATLGFSDELSGGIQSLLDRALGMSAVNKRLQEQGFTGDIGPTSPQELYTQARNEERQALAQAKAASPNAFMAGELLGASLAPAGSISKTAGLAKNVLTGAKVGAATGAATAAGTSEEMPTVGEVAKDAALGATLGAAVPLVGAGAKSAGKAIKESELGSYLTDLIKKSRAGVEFSGEEALSNLRQEALKETKDVITKVDKSNLSKIKKRDELFSKVQDVDVKEETANLLEQLDTLKREAAVTAEPIIKNTENQINRVFQKGAKITGDDYKMLEKRLQENIDKASLNKDTQLQEVLQNYQNLIKDKVYESQPSLSQVRKDIRSENEMLKLLTGEAAPDLAKYSPAEMEKLAEQSLSRLEAPRGTANFAQTQKFFEGVEQTPGVRGMEIPGFQNVDAAKSIQLSDKLRNLELSKKLNREGITQGTVTPTGLISSITGGLQSLAGQGAVTVGKGLKNYDKMISNLSNNVVRNDNELAKITAKLAQQGKQGAAKVFSEIQKSPDIKKRQALMFSALQQPNIRKDIEDLGFEEAEAGEDENE